MSKNFLINVRCQRTFQAVEEFVNGNNLLHIGHGMLVNLVDTVKPV